MQPNPNLSSDLFNSRQLLDKIIESAQKLMPFDAGGMAIWDMEREVLIPYFSWHEVEPLEMPEYIKLGQGIVGTVAQSLEPALISDVHKSDIYLGIYGDIRSELAVPIVLNDQLLGVLDIESYEVDAYNETHLMILQALADQAAIVLNSTNIYQELSRNYEHLQDTHRQMTLRNSISEVTTSNLPLEEALPRMAEYLTQLAEVDVCAITVWDPVQKKTVRLSAWGTDEEVYKSEQNRPPELPSLTRTIVQDGEIVILNDAQSIAEPPTPLIVEFNAKSLIAIPLIARGRNLGAIFLIRTKTDEPFELEIIESLRTSLDQIGLGIDNHLLLRETQASLNETSALLEIASISANVIKQDEMVPQALEAIQSAMNIEAAGILLFDTHTESLVTLPYGIGFSQRAQNINIPIDMPDSVMAEVFRIGLPRYINDISELKGLELTLAQVSNLTNVLIVPLRVQFHPIGILVVGNRAEGFTGSEAGFLAAAGSHIASTLRHTELLEDTRARLRETVMLQQIASITSTTLDLDEMLIRTIRATSDLMQVDGAILLRPNPTETGLVPHEISALGVARDWLELEWFLEDDENDLVKVFQRNEGFVSNEPVIDGIFKYENLLAVPLVTAHKTMGVLCLVNRRDANFQESHEVFVTALSSHIAAHMQNAMRFTHEQKRALVMGIANNISREITENLASKGMFPKLCELLNVGLEYEMVAVLLSDDDGYLEVLGFASSNPNLKLNIHHQVDIQEGIVVEAINQQSIEVDNSLTDEDLLVKSLHMPQLQSMMVIPLRRERMASGVLLIASTQIGRFSDLDLEVMEILAPQIGSVLENAQLYNQAQRRLLQQGIVQQIGQDFASTLNYTELMQAIARHMTRAIDTSSCLVAVYSARDEMVRIEADYRIGHNDKDRITVEPLLVGSLYAIEARPAMMQAIANKSTVTIYRDDETCPFEQREVLRRLDAYSQMIVPMIVGDRIIGVVDWMERRKPRIFTGEDERLAMILVAQASVAVENARLFRESERRATQQALLRQVAVELGRVNQVDELLEYIAEVVIESLQADDVAIATRASDQRLNVLSTRTSTIDAKDFVLNKLSQIQDAPQLWNFLQNGYTVHVEPTSEPANYAARELQQLVRGFAGTAIVTPINQRGQLLGVIEVRINLNNSLFDLQTIQMLESLADQTAIAIDNLMLYQREQKRLDQIERVQESSKLISAELYLPNLLDLIVQETAKIFDVNGVSIEFPDAQNIFYVIRMAYGLSQRFIVRRRTPIDPMMNSIAESVGVPIYIDALDAIEEDTTQMKLIQKEKITSVLNIPLIKGSEVLGYLRLYHFQGEAHQTYTEQDHEIAQLFASQVTIALENAKLVGELEERAIELAEANRLKSDFLATMSHELRTPMNSIIGFSDTLLSGIYGDLNEKQISRVERIHRNGRNLLALIDDLLDLSKIEAGKMEIDVQTIDLYQEIQACIQAIESQLQRKGLTLETFIPVDLPKVQADSLRLRQIINNLLSNAIKFTREGSVTMRVEVHTEVMDDGSQQKMIWTSVTDTGIGIKPQDQAVIFDEFRQADGSTTREFGGTGLGLAICKRLLEVMNGRIWVESRLGKGSTFIFTLPAA